MHRSSLHRLRYFISTGAEDNYKISNKIIVAKATLIEWDINPCSRKPEVQAHLQKMPTKECHECHLRHESRKACKTRGLNVTMP